MTPEGYTRVYVGGLNESIKKEDLQMEFEKYGKLNKVWVAFNPPGFAFIEFFNMNEAELACCNMNGMEIMGAKLRVEISRGRGRGGGRGGGSGGFRGNRGVGSREFGSRGGTGAGYRGSNYADYGGSYYAGRSGTNRGRGRYGEDYMFNRSSGYVTRDGYAQDVYSGSSGDTGADYYTGKDTSTARYRSRSPAGRGRYHDTYISSDFNLTIISKIISLIVMRYIECNVNYSGLKRLLTMYHNSTTVPFSLPG
ncbi:rna-binding protein rsf1 [Lasius niger]|uniref:Rna-binding protein rsf1 n=1 Tax=Lasius niger TaxID=67767 RepID=A0A0J7KXB5_LASNI|nr:rna-binding protein rsf1 [Lasius niger]